MSETFYVGDKVEKHVGTYTATGTIVARFHTTRGDERYVFEFDSPPGLLHIFNGKQLRRFEDRGFRAIP